MPETTIKLHVQDIRDYVRRRAWSELREALRDVPSPEIADALLETEKAERVLLFRALERRQAADVFSYLKPDQQESLLYDLSDEETRQLLANLPPDDRTQLLEELPGQATQRLLNLLGPKDLKEARELLGYPDESVGRIMTPDYVAVKPDWTIQRALDHIRRRAAGSETINRIYVVDKRWKLIDDIELRRLILADPEATIESIMDHSYVSVSAVEDQEEAARIIQRYDIFALPVVDSEGVLVGMVTVDDLLDVVEEEATEDFHKLGSSLPVKGSLRQASIWFLYRARIGWLLILVFINIFSGAGIAAFEETIEAVVALVFFLPLLIDSGGNAGSQAATLMVRALAIGDVEQKDWLALVGRELVVAVGLGLTMALGVSIIASFRAPEVLVVVSVTMIIIVLVGSIIGMSLPFLLSKLNLDPATASAPLITSIADICGVLIYFSIARWYLGF